LQEITGSNKTTMSIRRAAREAAMQFLYQEEFTVAADDTCHDLKERFAFFCSLYLVNKKARPYAFELLSKTGDNLTEIDARITKAAENWRLPRLAATDRNLLRIAVCELLYCDDIPGQVTINEAVEIAKRFAADDSPQFINGILDAIHKQIGSPAN
jgi:N utilization substance protein B